MKALGYGLKNTLLIITAVYIFGILVCFPLIYDVFTTEFLWFDGNPVPIFTPDAGLHGFYAKSILAGVTYPFGAEHFLGYVISAVVTVTGFPIDWVMLFLPIVIAPLIVIPMVLFAKAVNDIKLGAIASLFAVSLSYFYGRVSLGFTDTDMFTLLFPLITVLFMVLSLKQQKLIFALFGAASMLMFSHIYHSSASINLLLLGSFGLFTLVYMRKESFVYYAFLLMSISIVPMGFFTALSAMGVLWGLLEFINRKTSIPYYYFLSVFLVVLALLPFVVDLSYLYSRALDYFDKQEYYTIVGINGTYTFQHGLKTVAETEVIDFLHTMLSFNISKVMVVLSIIGFVLLLKKEKYYWLLAPFALLGSFSFFAGYRFSFFYTPVYAFGFSYFIIAVSSMLHKRYSVERVSVYLTFLVLLFHMLNILEMNKGSYVRMLAYSEEKEVLEKLSTKLTKDDKIVTWWDFGWPLWYFSGYKNTLVDNGAHGGPDSYMMSKILTESNQTFVANAAKYFANNKKTASKEGHGYVTPYLASKYDLKELFSSFYTSHDIKAEQDTYIVLHRNMVTIFNTIVSFSDFNYLDVNDKTKDEFKFRF
ncbi:STT3 domain-containing protein, partial [Sulfurovum sp.]|uniref:STT3 domain-containing protein n=1 Tax=Sulfurovum sp. TaxID=1969726 RepID=UPI003567793B